MIHLDWDRIGALFDEALQLEGAEREAFVSGLGEAEVAEELRSLLSAHEGRGRFDELADYVTGPDVKQLLHLAPGDLLGPYRIVREIARGGMAVVYEAQDVKHEREVAIKVLRPELAALVGADRFVREMKTTAKLQHPHILALFDSGEAVGLLYFVMPYIEGETLRARLSRETQLGVEVAVGITTEVADALDYAHRHGVIHRDIKPGNILLQEGRPLVADFGIALAMSAAAGERTTEAGVPLGTPHYMSPEQAAAEKDLTHRTDIYSLGCVLYEMLAGAPPYTGTSAGQIIRRIVADEARPVAELRKTVPPNVAAALGKSLEKLPADRFESAGAFAEALNDPTFTASSLCTAPKPRWDRLKVGLAMGAAVVAVVGLWGWSRMLTRPVERPVVEFTLAPPESTMFFGGGLALSPDGQRLVAKIGTAEGWALYQRLLDERQWWLIPGTEGASDPFFSPDGQWLGFFSASEGAIKIRPVGGGSAQNIARARWIWGASWGPDNTVVYTTQEATSTSVPTELYRVAVNGGVPERLTIQDPEFRDQVVLDPYHLSGGRVLLFVSGMFPPVISALSLESGRAKRLTAGMSPRSDPAGRVIYVTSDGVAQAQEFNPNTLDLEGSPTPVAEGLALWNRVDASYSVSADGSVAYLSSLGAGEQLLLVSRDGETRLLFTPPAGSVLRGARFSPSGDRIAFMLEKDVWVYSLSEGTARRLSFESPAAAGPTWSSDGRSIGYSVASDGEGSTASLYVRSADGTGSARQILAAAADLWEMDFAPGDSEVVVFSGSTVWRASLGNDSVPVPLMETEAFVAHATVSPDGGWIAYRSNESGINEVYARPYPDMGPPTIVSIGGGSAPAWSSDGSEIFYWCSGHLMAASLRYEGSRLTVVDRTRLFGAWSFSQGWNRSYDVHPNGREFVMVGRPSTRIIWRVNALAGKQ